VSSGLAASFLISRSAGRRKRLAGLLGHAALFLTASSSALAILFIFYYIFRDALPFFRQRGLREFLFSTAWYPSSPEPAFGALAIFYGSGLVTAGAVLFAVPLGVSAAICLSDTLPFRARQMVKPVIEILAAIPSVAFGFLALVVLAPHLQQHGGTMLAVVAGVLGLPVAALGTWVASDLCTTRWTGRTRQVLRGVAVLVLGAIALLALYHGVSFLKALQIASGTNALNVALVLGIMALPTIVSVSEDALQAVGRELREGAYALGATRAETMLFVVIPAARSGIAAAIILGIMRAIGETMVVWMASGNAAQIPTPWYNLLQPVRTLTATIAGDMGEADHVTGSARYHVLFAMALCLVVISYTLNLVSEHFVRRGGRVGRR